MLEEIETLLPGLDDVAKGIDFPAFCVCFDTDAAAEEIERLLTTLGARPAGRVMVHLRAVNPATYIGEGKIAEIRAQAEELKARCIVVDAELSPNQLRNLEKSLGKPVLDRPGVIIEIFSRHARTRESKTQVALARMQYLLPRLAHFWDHFERQRGGSPGSRGMGEKQIEVDRRLVQRQISVLKGRLVEIAKERKVQRAGRKNVLKVALVGYTNAGKSTLLNALTHSKVLAENKLFATLDSSVRALDPDAHPPIVAIDTVGFISRLPHSLIASFRSTLEELERADLLVHVVDASSSQASEELQVAEKVLDDLGVGEKPRFTVLNKVDLIGGALARNRARVVAPGAHFVSALKGDDVERLRQAILKHFHAQLEQWDVMIPYAESKLESQIHAHGVVETIRPMEKGLFFRIRIEPTWARKLGLGKFRL
ncbi:GTPase HflX [Bdellovibrionota bacterium FG-2]